MIAKGFISMSKIYQPIKNNPYRLRDSVYPFIVWIIRDVARYDMGYYNGYAWLEYKPPQNHVEAVNTALQEIKALTKCAIYM